MGAKKYPMKKYTPRLLAVAEEWVAKNGLMEFGGALLGDYCAFLGINYKSHYNWLKDHKEYVAMLDRAKDTYLKAHTKKLYDTLMEAATGYYRENSTEDAEFKPHPQNPEKPVIAKKRTHKENKWVNPNVAAAIFLLTNIDPDHFSNRQRNDISVRRDTEEDNMSLDEIREELKRLEEGG